VVADTTPSAARNAIAGTIYEGFVPDAQLRTFAESWRVLSAVLVEGRTNKVRVHSASGQHPEGFSPATATLEDAYLVLMRTPVTQVPAALRKAEVAVAVVGAGGAA
jgi:hypothetical protein